MSENSRQNTRFRWKTAKQLESMLSDNGDFTVGRNLEVDGNIVANGAVGGAGFQSSVDQRIARGKTLVQSRIKIFTKDDFILDADMQQSLEIDATNCNPLLYDLATVDLTELEIHESTTGKGILVSVNVEGVSVKIVNSDQALPISLTEAEFLQIRGLQGQDEPTYSPCISFRGDESHSFTEDYCDFAIMQNETTMIGGIIFNYAVGLGTLLISSTVK